MGFFDNDEKTRLQKLLALKQEAKRARRPFEVEGWLNLAFFHGQHYTEWFDGGKGDGNIREIPRGEGEDDVPRPVFNKIQNYILTAHNETLQDKPSLDVLPANDDWSGLIDADVNKAYLNYAMEPVNIDWDKQLARAVLWALITPSGWLKWIWDPALKRADVIPRSFFSVYVDPFAPDFKRARYAIDTMFMDPEQVKDTWGIDVKNEDIAHTDEMRIELLRGMGSTVASKGVIVNELWMKPNKQNPRGLYALFTNTKIIKIGDLPYKHLQADGGRLPFTQLGSLMRPDSMYYTSPVTALRPAQMVWNKFIAQVIQTTDAFANPKWWIPDDLQMKEMPNSSPRQILRGNSGSAGLKPEIIVPPNTPDMSRLLDMFEQQMMHVVSVHEVSQGQVPGRVEAAKAIELLKSSDEGMYKHLLDTIDSAISEGAWQMLMLAREFETEEKMVQVYSREGVPLVKRWRRGNADPGTRIKTVRMSGLGRTRAQRTESLMNMWTNGVIRDPDLMAELMDVPIPSFTNAKAHDKRTADSENYEMAAAIPVAPNSWDNHAIHLREHNEYRKTTEFRALPAKTKAIFEFHCQKHKALQLQAAQESAVLLMAAQGQSAPPQPGGGGPGAVGSGGGADPNAGVMYMDPQVGPGSNPNHP